MSNYGIYVGDFATFSPEEKLNYTVKVALKKVTTDMEQPWFSEPNDYISKEPGDVYKKKIPTWSEIKTYLVIDPDVDGNGKEMVTDQTVNNILGGANKGPKYTLEQILDNTVVRNPDEFASLQGSDFVDNTNNKVIKKLGRNMFTRYKYWKSQLTGKKSTLPGGSTNSSIDDESGTYPDVQEPFNAFMTYTESGGLSSERIWRNLPPNDASEDHQAFYNKLKPESNVNSSGQGIELSIISPDYKLDLTKKHPFIKLCLQVLTYTTRGSQPVTSSDGSNTSGAVNPTDNIGFHNPMIFKALGDSNGFLAGAGYQVTGWDDSSQQWKTITTSTGTAGYQNIVYFLSGPGFLFNYGQKNIDYGNLSSRSYPPMVSYLKYTGETLDDGIISQLPELPPPQIYKNKDLIINTTTNTIHRLKEEAGVKSWQSIGGSSSAGSSSNTSSTISFLPTLNKAQVLERKITQFYGEQDQVINYYKGNNQNTGGGGYSVAVPGSSNFEYAGIFDGIDLQGSSINYSPPNATNKILYTFSLFLTLADPQIPNVPLYKVDNNFPNIKYVAPHKAFLECAIYLDNIKIDNISNFTVIDNVKYVDPNNGNTVINDQIYTINYLFDTTKFNKEYSDWNGEKTIKIKARSLDSRYKVKVNYTKGTKLSITSIGDAENSNSEENIIENICSFYNGSEINILGSPNSLLTLNDITQSQIVKQKDTSSSETFNGWNYVNNMDITYFPELLTSIENIKQIKINYSIYATWSNDTVKMYGKESFIRFALLFEYDINNNGSIEKITRMMNSHQSFKLGRFNETVFEVNNILELQLASIKDKQGIFDSTSNILWENGITIKLLAHSINPSLLKLHYSNVNSTVIPPLINMSVIGKKENVKFINKILDNISALCDASGGQVETNEENIQIQAITEAQVIPSDQETDVLGSIITYKGVLDMKQLFYKFQMFMTWNNGYNENEPYGINNDCLIELSLYIKDNDNERVLPTSKRYVRVGNWVEKMYQYEYCFNIVDFEETDDNKNILNITDFPFTFKLKARSVFAERKVKLFYSNLNSQLIYPTIGLTVYGNISEQIVLKSGSGTENKHKINLARWKNKNNQITTGFYFKELFADEIYVKELITSQALSTDLNDDVYILSDDRLKHNEVKITNALKVLEQITPKQYIKTKELYDTNHNFILDNNGVPLDKNINYKIESGIIAQEILDISAVNHSVNGTINDENGVLEPYPKNPLSINYNDIFVYGIAGIKELHQELKNMKKEIADLKRANIELTKKINDL